MTLRPSRLVPVLLVLTAALAGLPGAQAPAFAGTAALNVSPAIGPPTTTIQVSGRGFAPGEAVEVALDARPLVRVLASQAGSFSSPLIIPTSARPGSHLVSASGASGQHAKGSFLVRTDWSTFHFSMDRRGANPYENVLSPSTVGGLQVGWTHQMGDGVDSSPAVVGGVVYAGDFTGDLDAVDAATGSLVWSRTLPGCADSPTVAGGVLYLATCLGDAIYALDADTGDTIWSKLLGGGVFGAPAVSGGKVFIGSTSGTLYALDAETGATVWKWTARIAVGWSSPSVKGGIVYVGSDDAKVRAFDVSDGALLWATLLGTGVYGSPVALGGILYVGVGNFAPYFVYALVAASGSILWSTPVGGQVLNTVSVAGGLVYVGTEDDTLYALDARTGEVRWSFPAGDVFILDSPVVANGVVYVGNGDFVYALDAASGAQLWSNLTGGPINVAPAVANGMLYIGSFDKNLYAFRLP